MEKYHKCYVTKLSSEAVRWIRFFMFGEELSDDEILYREIMHPSPFQEQAYSARELRAQRVVPLNLHPTSRPFLQRTKRTWNCPLYCAILE